MKKILLALLFASTAHAAEIGPLTYVAPNLMYDCPSGRPTRSTAFAINGATDEIHWAFQAEKSITATKVGFVYGARTGTPVQHRIGIQLMSTTTNRGDGSYIQKEEFTPPADTTWDGTEREVTLEASVSLTAGTWYAVVIIPVGTPDGSNTSSFYGRFGNCSNRNTAYQVTVDGGTPTVQNGIPMFSIETASETFYYPMRMGCFDAATCTFTTGERGIRFNAPPATTCSTVSLIGARIMGGPNGGGGTLTMRVYSGGGASDTSAAETTTLDTDNKQGTSGSTNGDWFLDTPVTLTCGSTYRISFEIATNTMEFQTVIVNDNDDLGAFGVDQENSYKTTRSGGNWTDSTIERPYIFPLFGDWTTSGGGGGGGLSSQKSLSGGTQ